MTPRPRLIAAVLGAGIPFLAAPWSLLAEWIGIVATGCVLLVAFWDLRSFRRLSAVEAVRQLPGVITPGRAARIRVWLRNAASESVTVQLQDSIPVTAGATGLPKRVRLAPLQTEIVEYRITIPAAGTAAFGRLELRSKTDWGFWTLQVPRGDAVRLQVSSGAGQLQALSRLARENRIAVWGVRLVDAQPSSNGDLPTGMAGGVVVGAEPGSRGCRPGRSQLRVARSEPRDRLFVIDRGLSMSQPHEGRSLFAHCVEAIVSAGWVALRNGDRISVASGVMACDSWIGPLRRVESAGRLQRGLAGLEPAPRLADYLRLCGDVLRRLPRQTDIIFVAHAQDDVHVDAIARGLAVCAGRHRVQAVLLHRGTLQQRGRAVPATDRGAFQVSAAATLWTARRRRLEVLSRSGVGVWSCTPEQLPRELLGACGQLRRAISH